MAIRAVFFDIDGVVVLSEPLHQEKIVATAADPLRTGKPDSVNGVMIDIDAQWHELAGIGDHRVYEWIKSKNPAFPLTEEQFLAQGEEYYLKNVHRLTVRDGFKEAFDYFKNAGLPVAAVSSGVRAQVDVNLDVAGVAGKFEFSHSADDIEHGKTKPHPAPYLNALKELNTRLKNVNPLHVDIRAEESLVIEDSSSGVASGHAAGMVTVHWTLSNEGKYNTSADYKLKLNDSLPTLAKSLVPASDPTKSDAKQIRGYKPS